MSAQAIDNTGFKDYCNGGCDVAGFTPKVSYVYDTATKKVAVTDASTFPNGSPFKIIHVKVHDHFGNEAKGQITAAGGNVSVDVKDLNASEAFNITATVIGENSLIADGSAFNIKDAGDLSRWDIQKNA